MREGDSADKLSAKSEFVLVLRLVVEGGGKVTGELVDPVSERRHRFTGARDLVEGVQSWMDDAVKKVRRDEE
ncbi:hypothetical protein CQY20_09250 [Mycolicibacterium agri]|uniref:Uncharacterized protein n=1 Tax=Mycolicibacterium agri TaxID=36811 RepID=A0A2A7N7B8_MYCAG|nr:hypothetical protein [Mycolicibacterium agri]PEG39729.1 hypothetical protein CQY20_09250 [Mycolicibacterium agri]GFG52563.1 hypothetical protein MAGR_40040 [Mycolicibacterium agri]